MYFHRSCPLPVICCGLGRVKTTFGSPILHPSEKLFAGGASFGSPAGAEASAQRRTILICWSVSRQSLEKWPSGASADQGGIAFVSTASLIAAAQGRTC